MSHLTVRQIGPSETKHLRHRVLWPHIGEEEDCIIDIDHRADAIHLGTFDEDKLISVGSLFQMSSEKLPHAIQYRLRAMATDPEERGRHAGKLLVNTAIGILREMNVEVLWCDARLHATGFYSALGFEKKEEIYQVPLIGPHQFMWIGLQSPHTEK